MDKSTDPRLQRVIEFYQTLTAASVDSIGDVYAENASFKDPFNDVRGIAGIRRILAKMFEDLTDARFVIRESVTSETTGFITWDFTFRIRKLKPGLMRHIHGASQVRFDGAGKVSMHRDYWDAAGELYEKLPLIGAVMRCLRAKMG